MARIAPAVRFREAGLVAPRAVNGANETVRLPGIVLPGITTDVFLVV